MRMFLLNILLAILWMFMWGSFGIYDLLAGFLIGYPLLGLYSRAMAGRGYGARGVQLISFAIYFVRTLVQANLLVAYVIVTPGFQMDPRIVRYPVRGLTPTQVTTLANAITLTPGTLTVDISEDNQDLYIHCMFARDRDRAVRELDDLRERILKEVF